MKKAFIRGLSFVLAVLLIVAGLPAFDISIQGQAAEAEDTQKALRAYQPLLNDYRYIQKLRIDTADNIVFSSEACQFVEKNSLMNDNCIETLYYSSDARYRYALYDIDHNGTYELIIEHEGSLGGDNGKSIAVYTHKNGQVFLLQSASYRSDMEIYTNGYIVVSGSGGASYHVWFFYKISADGSSLNIKNELVLDSQKYSDFGKKISEEQFNAVFDLIQTKPMSLSPSDLIIHAEWYDIMENPKEITVFNEKMYIADLWLGRIRPDSPQMYTIKNITDLKSLSKIITDSCRGNNTFMNSVGMWEGFKTVFDTAEQRKDKTYGMTEIYEKIIFDLLEKSMGDDNTENPVTKAVKAVDTAADTVDQYTKPVLDMIDLIGSSYGNIADLDLQYLTDKITIDDLIKLRSVQDKCEVITESKIAEALGLLIKESKTIGDFFENFTKYQMAVNMVGEMKEFLSKIKKYSDNDFLTDALNNILSSVDNADYASLVLAGYFGEGTALNCASELLKAVKLSNPATAFLQLGYDAGTFVADLFCNTSDIIDAFYECQAMTLLMSATKSAISALRESYQNDQTEIKAGAFIYALRTYRHLYEVDLDCAANFIKQATDKGLVNNINSICKSISNAVFGTSYESDYASFVKNADSIKNSISLQFDSLMNSWKYTYLREDYPDMYPYYAIKEFLLADYAPIIKRVGFDAAGNRVIEWDQNYLSENETVLWGTSGIDGYEVQEIGPKTVTKTVSDFSASFSDNENMGCGSLSYKVRAYTDTIYDKVYSKEGTYVFDTITKTTILPIMFGGKWMVGIYDRPTAGYDNIYYHIYRADSQNGAYKEIAKIEKDTIFGLYSTIFEDKSADGQKMYYYKVKTELYFSNGNSIITDYSDVISFCDPGKDVTAGDITVTYHSSSAESKTRNAFFPRTAAAAGDTVSLSWKASENVDKYEIYRLSSYGSMYVKTAETTQTNWTDYDINNGTSYDYIVLPCKKDGNGTAYQLDQYKEEKLVLEYEPKSSECSHDFAEGEGSEPATCISDGSKYYKCTKCGAVKSEKISKTNTHIWDIGVITKDPTSALPGIKTYTCTVCRKTKTEEIPKLSAVIDSGDCGAEGCNVTWTLSDDGVLIIEGEGKMVDYSYFDPAPWFPYKNSIKSVIIKKGVQNVGIYAFYGCSVLTEADIPVDLTSIGAYAFCDCSSLSHINIPEEVTTIEYYTFFKCQNLSDVTIHETVTKIEGSAFAFCAGLTTIDIPAATTIIESFAFEGCSGIRSITVDEKNPVYHSQNNCLIETSSRKLLAGCKNSVIPSDGSVTVISDAAFEGCDKLSEIEIPDTVTTISDFAFWSCTELTKIFIPDSVKTIANNTFQKNNDLVILCEEGSAAYYFAQQNGFTYKILCKVHTPVNKEMIAPGCMEPGFSAGVYCTTCDTWLSGHELINAFGHVWDSGTITTEPTPEMDGVKTYTCTVCKATKTELLPKTEEESIFVLGDVSFDGLLSAADARLTLRAAVGLDSIPAGTEAFTAADVDKDGKITAADARLILRAAVGLESLL